MRPRKIIEEQVDRCGYMLDSIPLTLEVLLDIRELITRGGDINVLHNKDNKRYIEQNRQLIYNHYVNG